MGTHLWSLKSNLQMYKLLKINSKNVCNFSIRKNSYYELLGIPQNATEKEIRNAFKQKSLLCHPDKFPNDANKETEFKSISEAYTVLSDNIAKREYDQKQGGP